MLDITEDKKASVLMLGLKGRLDTGTSKSLEDHLYLLLLALTIFAFPMFHLEHIWNTTGTRCVPVEHGLETVSAHLTFESQVN
jgi:hypothetical protein